jgi:hypothetical protein
MPYIGRSTDGFGVRNRFIYLASSGATSVSGADANGATLTFTDGAYVDVYLNGVLLKPTTDYNTSTAGTIAGLSALNTNDEVTVVVYDVFTVADMVSAASGGTFSGGVTVGSTLDVTGNVSLDGGSFVFNESGADKDFRIESDNLDDAFFVEGSTGNIGLGTTSPNSIVSGNSHLDIRSGTYSFLEVGTTATTTSSDVGYLEFMNGNNTRLATVVGGADGANNDGYLRISTANGGSFTERMRINHDGDVFFGVTALPSSSTGGAGFQEANNNRNVLYLATSVSSNTSLAVFINSNGQVGGIKTSGSATAFNTSSDYRLKENVNYSWDATSRLKQLKPARFNFINDADTTVDGFLAHEVSSIVPEAISGEKDATEEISNVVLNADGTVKAQNISKTRWEAEKLSTIDEDGNTIDPIYASDTTWVESKTVPDYQQIDQSKLVPLLVKTIQELEARVTALESK